MFSVTICITVRVYACLCIRLIALLHGLVKQAAQLRDWNASLEVVVDIDQWLNDTH